MDVVLINKLDWISISEKKQKLSMMVADKNNSKGCIHWWFFKNDRFNINTAQHLVDSLEINTTYSLFGVQAEASEKDKYAPRFREHSYACMQHPQVIHQTQSATQP